MLRNLIEDIGLHYELFYLSLQPFRYLEKPKVNYEVILAPPLNYSGGAFFWDLFYLLIKDI